MSDHAVSVSIPTRWIVGFHTVGAAVGFGAAFIVGPLVHWLLGLIGDAPGPLRLAALLPTMWAIPVLTLVGLFTGHLVASNWQKESGSFIITPEGVTHQREGTGQHVARTRIDGVFTDGQDLVLVDDHSAELLRVKADDVLVTGLKDAFEHHGYPWMGTSDPQEDAFTTWIDGAGSLPAGAHDLLRTRRRLLADKQPGAAEGILDKLRELGVMVRDRGGAQQYRAIPPRKPLPRALESS